MKKEPFQTFLSLLPSLKFLSKEKKKKNNKSFLCTTNCSLNYKYNAQQITSSTTNDSHAFLRLLSRTCSFFPKRWGYDDLFSRWKRNFIGALKTPKEKNIEKKYSRLESNRNNASNPFALRFALQKTKSRLKKA